MTALKAVLKIFSRIWETSSSDQVKCINAWTALIVGVLCIPLLCLVVVLLFVAVLLSSVFAFNLAAACFGGIVGILLCARLVSVAAEYNFSDHSNLESFEYGSIWGALKRVDTQTCERGCESTIYLKRWEPRLKRGFIPKHIKSNQPKYDLSIQYFFKVCDKPSASQEPQDNGTYREYEDRRWYEK